MAEHLPIVFVIGRCEEAKKGGAPSRRPCRVVVVGLPAWYNPDQGGIAVSQRPIAIGLLLCEQLIVEEGTKNVTPVNCFTHRTAEAFPWTSPPFTVVAWLTNGEGELLLEVVIEDTDTLEELYRRGATFRLTTPLQHQRLSLRINAIAFPRPKTYRVLLQADGEIIAQRKLGIVPKETSDE
jgi:hypothetical protein